MKPKTLIISAFCYFIGGAITILITRAISIEKPELSFVVGAILASQVGALLHHRQPGAEPTVSAKATLGAVLAVCAIILGFILHLTFNPFTFVAVSISISAVGSFVFPFVLFNTMWKALTKAGSKSKPTDV